MWRILCLLHQVGAALCQSECRNHWLSVLISVFWLTGNYGHPTKGKRVERRHFKLTLKSICTDQIQEFIMEGEGGGGNGSIQTMINKTIRSDRGGVRTPDTLPGCTIEITAEQSVPHLNCTQNICYRPPHSLSFKVNNEINL